jgi:60 kDa SS-A/Ro ribonucleoprotein
MASKDLFSSKKTSAFAPATDTKNAAGGVAYKRADEEALAQFAVTGCFNNTFYASSADQLTKVKELLGNVSPATIGTLAVYSRTHGHMKDMPTFFVGYLSGLLAKAAEAEEVARKVKSPDIQVKADAVRALSEILWDVFPRVIDNGKMLRNYVQMIRSGETGRKSFGSSPKRLVRAWFDTRDDTSIFFNSTGNSPSMADVIKLVRPVPMTEERAALYGWLLGKEKGKFGDKEFVVADAAPVCIKEYEAFRKNPKIGEIPKAPYEMIEGLDLSVSQWKELAVRSTWNQIRQHLNTFLRKGVFTSSMGQWDSAVIKAIVSKITDEAEIKKAKAMPYQLMVAYKHMGPEMPVEITNAIQDAMEIAVANVPVIDGIVAVFPDASGSMHSPVTGQRINPKTKKLETHTSKVQCVDVAALVAACVLRRNPKALIIPFVEKALTDVILNPKDSIMTNAMRLSSLPCGGTNCSAPMAALNSRGVAADLVWYISDYESWVDTPNHNHFGGSSTETLRQWEILKGRNSKAKLVCMDITPNTTTQAKTRDGIINVGGFSDSVFTVVQKFWEGDGGMTWMEHIQQMVG